MSTQRYIGARADALARRAIRVVQSIPNPALRMRALTEMLSSTDQQLARDVGMAMRGGVNARSALTYGYGRMLQRVAASRGMGDWLDDLRRTGETAEQITSTVDAVAGAATSVIGAVGNIYQAGEEAFGSGGGTTTPRITVPARTLRVSVQEAPFSACQRAGNVWADGRCMTPAEHQQWLQAQSPGVGGMLGSLPSWLLPVGAAAAAFGAWKLLGKKKRKGAAKK